MDIYALAWPFLRRMTAENAHRLTIRLLQTGLLPIEGKTSDDAMLAMSCFGLKFKNPIGLAAGFDKNAEVPDAILRLGFGFLEVGSVTPRPQAGNPRPRLFRLIEDQAIINRMGFNNKGHTAMAARLQRRSPSIGLVGVNLGANKDSADRIADYVTGLEALGPLADFVVVNISSPNTPGLRTLQGRAELDELLGRLLTARERLKKTKPILLKIAPDLADEDLADIAAGSIKYKIDGLIISNTTIARPDSLQSHHRKEAGGLSGRPLMAPSTHILRQMYKLLGSQLTLIGVGGIASAADAYEKILAGASLLELYSALVYQGPRLIGQIKQGLRERLEADGYQSLREAVGAKT